AAHNLFPSQYQSKLVLHLIRELRGGKVRMQKPFHYFNSSPEIVRLAVMMYSGGIMNDWFEAFPKGECQRRKPTDQ
ncbi:MAG: hypothetical protein O2985_17015, partial [Proteobacteria bacterium]|nr:hypothetical protein [Pseudomonadota bacterium]